MYERDHHGMQCGCRTEFVREIIVADKNATWTTDLNGTVMYKCYE